MAHMIVATLAQMVIFQVYKLLLDFWLYYFCIGDCLRGLNSQHCISSMAEFMPSQLVTDVKFSHQTK
jgi:hypothetical protein